MNFNFNIVLEKIDLNDGPICLAMLSPVASRAALHFLLDGAGNEVLSSD